MTPEEKAEKWYVDNLPFFQAADVCERDFVKAYLAGYAESKKKEIERDRDRILYEFDEPHQIEYELDVGPLVVRDFFTGNEWVTIQLIVKGKRGKILDKDNK